MITFELSQKDLSYIRRMSSKAELGGKSHIRTTDRLPSLTEDQLIGQIGQFVVTRYMFGTPEKWAINRWFINQNPSYGDAGYDIPGLNLDVKTSLMRASKDPMSYNLLVRPKERHSGWVYYLVLVGEIQDELLPVHLIGWAKDEDLPATPAKDGKFKGAYVLPAKSLVPLPPLRFNYFD